MSEKRCICLRPVPWPSSSGMKCLRCFERIKPREEVKLMRK